VAASVLTSKFGFEIFLFIFCFGEKLHDVHSAERIREPILEYWLSIVGQIVVFSHHLMA